MATVPAIRFRGAGGAEVIELGEIDVRDPGPGEVTVEVAASSSSARSAAAAARHRRSA